MNLALTWAEGPRVLKSRGLRAWASSLRKHSPDARIVILSPEKVSIPGAENIIASPSGPGICPEHRRFAAYVDVMAKSDERYVMLSDSRDIVFQGDPFAVCGSSSQVFFAASEQQKTGDHAWCVDKANKFAKLMGIKSDPSRIEINGGMQVADRSSMLTFLSAAECFLYGRTEPNLDQAFINWWLYERCPFPWQPAPDDWYIHGEAVKHNKQRIEIVDDQAHVVIDGLPATLPATVWHQYDRTGHSYICQRRSQQKMAEIDLLTVVSHFEEELRWLEELDCDYLIVSKGPNLKDGALGRENIGFEAETWAWFFETYYDQLPGVIVCLQGKPFDHIAEHVLKQLVDTMRQGDFSYTPISTHGHDGFTGIDTPDHHDLPMRKWWRLLFKSKPILNWHCPFGGQFAVTRDTVRQRPKDFYRTIRENCRTKNDACCLERLWQFIFAALP